MKGKSKLLKKYQHTQPDDELDKKIENEKLEKDKLKKEKLEEKQKTPYVGGTPDLKDSGGFCLHESKSVKNKFNWKTGKLLESTVNNTKVY